MMYKATVIKSPLSVRDELAGQVFFSTSNAIAKVYTHAWITGGSLYIKDDILYFYANGMHPFFSDMWHEAPAATARSVVRIDEIPDIVQEDEDTGYTLKIGIEDVEESRVLPEIKIYKGLGFNLAQIDVQGWRYYVCDNQETAGRYVRFLYEQMEEEDALSLADSIGSDRLMCWVLGRDDGYGITSLEGFIKSAEESPACKLSDDGIERKVIYCAAELAEQLGFVPKLAYCIG